MSFNIRSVMRKSRPCGISLILLVALAGCGGGGGGGSASTPTEPAVTENSSPSTSLITEPYVFAKGARSGFIAGGNYSFWAKLADVTIDPGTGAALKIADEFSSYELTGDRKFADLAGGSTWTVGRWISGNLVATGSQNMTRPGIGQSSSLITTYYAIVNPLSVIPTSGNQSCQTVAAPRATINAVGSTPTLRSTTVYFNPPKSDWYANISGDATLTFDSQGTTAKLSLTLSRAESSNTVRQILGMKGTDSTAIQGMLGGAGADVPGYGIVIGDGGNGDTLLLTYYQIPIDGDKRYHGVIAMRCR